VAAKSESALSSKIPTSPAPKTRRTSARPRKNAVTTAAQTEDEITSEAEPAQPARRRATRPKATAATASARRTDAATPEQVTEEVTVSKPARKRAAPRKKADILDEPQTAATVEADATPAPRKRGRPAKAKAVAIEDVSPEIVEDLPVRKKPGRKPRAAKPVEDAPVVSEELPEAPKRRRRTARQKVTEEPTESTDLPVHTADSAEDVIVPTDTTDVIQDAAPIPVEQASSEENTAETAEPLFSDLGLSAPLLQALADKGYKHPTPIQAQAIPQILQGKDVLGVAQTGTGKTASFTLPMLEILAGTRARARMPRSLILEPTRELALQVAENFVDYGKHLKLTHALLIGGESMAEQKEVLNRGVDVLIATPGRLIDLFERGGLLMNQTRILVIDEADRMLDMGFIPDIERIVGLLPQNRQTLFFSATMAPEIRRLADAFLHTPTEITVSRPSTVASTIETGLAIVDEHDKRRALRKMLRDPELQNAIVFCNRKRDVDVLYKSLQKHGFSVGSLHGDLPQSARFATLEKFKSGELKILVCSDVAARGIDIGGNGLSHVFNFDLPFHAEDYVHRIGRTGRAGRKGHAFSLAIPEDRLLAEAIEKLTGTPIPLISINGIESREWSTEEKPRRGKTRDQKPQDRKKGRNERNDRNDRRDHAVEVSEQEAPQPQQNRKRDDGRERDHDRRDDNRRDRRRDDNRRDRDRRGSLLHDAPANAVEGFGDALPAFMLLPRREHPVPVAEDSDRHNTDNG
jgi:superfamily II DNA/RNA helicase